MKAAYSRPLFLLPAGHYCIAQILIAFSCHCIFAIDIDITISMIEIIILSNKREITEALKEAMSG